MRVALLRSGKSLVAHMSLPGRYVLARIIAKTCLPPFGKVEGRVGPYRMVFDLRDEIQVQMYFGLYDPAETRLVQRLLKPGDVFLDVGANVGYYSLVASQLVGDQGKVHAFEPIAENLAVLKQAVEANGVANIIVNLVAVDVRAGELTLFVGDDDLGNSGWASQVPSQRRPKPVKVAAIRLDDYVRDHTVDRIRLVKLDIEGAELNALLGMIALLSQRKAPDLICEINPFLLNKQNLDSRALTVFLSEHGYRLFEVGALATGPLNPDRALQSVKNLWCTKKADGLAN